MSLRLYFVEKRDKALDRVELSKLKTPLDTLIFLKDINMSMMWHCCAYMFGQPWDK